MNPAEFTKLCRPTVLSRKTYNRIFCIGYNKTGTTTLEKVLKLYGFTLPNQQEQELRLLGASFHCNYAEFQNFVAQYDAFQDYPFSHVETYVAADALFPDSRFILSERNADDWFRSLASFHKKIYNLSDTRNLTEADVFEKFNYLYKGYGHEKKRYLLTSYSDAGATVSWDRLYDRDYYIKEYEDRNNRIKKYFMNRPEKLLVLDITKEETTAKICDFLNIPEQFAITMPHANKT
jgi:hypothetical protein